LLLALLGLMVGCSSEEEEEKGPVQENPNVVEEDVHLSVREGEIKGTITLPKEGNADQIAIIIAGSGPTDRDGNNPGAGINNGLKMMAHGLAEENIASIRYDKRGIGESQGLVQSEKDLVFEDYVKDVVGWVEKAKEDGRFEQVVLIGHSEGALIGAAAAAQSEVDGYVSVSGAGSSASDLLERQLKEQSDEIYKRSKPIIDQLKAGNLVEDPPEELASLFRESVQPYLISWFQYDPTEIVAQLDMPVLILQGERDIQVGVEDAKRLKEAKPDAELVLIEDMNHVLKHSPEERSENLKTYNDPDLPIHEELMKALIRFFDKI